MSNIIHMKVLIVFLSIAYANILIEDPILPYQVECCDTYNQLSCTINNRCSWNILKNECNYKAEPLSFERELCLNRTDLSSCNARLDHDLSTITPFELRTELQTQSEEQFPSPPQPEVMKVTDGVYVAIGYALANSIIIESETGMIIIDTLSEATAARKVFNDYKSLRIDVDNNRKEEQMRIDAIILTHYHTDHSMGVAFWFNLNAENGCEYTPKIYANEEIIEGFKRFFLYSFFSIAHRATRQFGTLLYHFIDNDIVKQKNLFANSGIGPHVNREDNATFVNPLKEENFVLIEKKRFPLKIQNINLLLINAPGETSDQTAIWYEYASVLFVGDNFYYAFPNLYSIRGTTPRDPKLWMESLQKFIDFNAQYLVGSHTKPISGGSNIQNELILYKDLIGFVHDQTVRYMQKRYTIDHIVEIVEYTLPNILKSGRKQQFYGTVEWSVRSIYDMYLGWFQGDAAELYPSNMFDRGQGLYRIMKMLHEDDGSGDMIEILVTFLENIVDDAEANRDDSKYVHVALREERWALEMVSYLSMFFGEHKQCESWDKLVHLRWKIMQRIAGRSVSANGRNYLITQYLEERFNIADDGLAITDVYLSFPVSWIVELLRFRVKPELILSDSKEWKTNIKFTDSGLMFQLTLRNGGVLSYIEYSKFDKGICESYDESAQLIYELEEINFKNGEISDMTHVTKGTIKNIFDFWGRFDRQVAVDTQGESRVQEEMDTADDIDEEESEVPLSQIWDYGSIISGHHMALIMMGIFAMCTVILIWTVLKCVRTEIRDRKKNKFQKVDLEYDEEEQLKDWRI